MSKAADEYEDIARRLKELEADRQLALTGSSAPVQVEAPKDIDWTSAYGMYTPSGYNDAARQYMAYKQAANQYNPFNSGLKGNTISNQANPYYSLGWPRIDG